jgi:hypothetical protein
LRRAGTRGQGRAKLPRRPFPGVLPQAPTQLGDYLAVDANPPVLGETRLELDHGVVQDGPASR